MRYVLKLLLSAAATVNAIAAIQFIVIWAVTQDLSAFFIADIHFGVFALCTWAAWIGHKSRK